MATQDGHQGTAPRPELPGRAGRQTLQARQHLGERPQVASHLPLGAGHQQYAGLLASLGAAVGQHPTRRRNGQPEQGRHLGGDALVLGGPPGPPSRERQAGLRPAAGRERANGDVPGGGPRHRGGVALNLVLHDVQVAGRPVQARRGRLRQVLLTPRGGVELLVGIVHVVRSFR
ncbi:hypothetical protein [Streptomyces sp. NBC_01568]|uniref:hypothetical protein n=1 Tax=Streptomyces sp. NBC_01568 TaxID=2975882 RepID=UPI002F91B892